MRHLHLALILVGCTQAPSNNDASASNLSEFCENPQATVGHSLSFPRDSVEAERQCYLNECTQDAGMDLPDGGTCCPDQACVTNHVVCDARTQEAVLIVDSDGESVGCVGNDCGSCADPHALSDAQLSGTVIDEGFSVKKFEFIEPTFRFAIRLD